MSPAKPPKPKAAAPKTAQPKTAKGGRKRLSAERVIEGAVALADQIGVDAMTIRKLADAIDVKPMTIYHHVPNKEAIIDGMVDAVFTEVKLPPTDLPWRTAVRVRTESLRNTLNNHPWACALLETRTSPGLATLKHHDAMLGCFRSAGFSLELTGHAYAVVDAFAYGFSLQETTLPETSGDELSELAEEITAQMPVDMFPHMAEFATEYVMKPGYDYRKEFDYGLDLILDGLEHALKAEN